MAIQWPRGKYNGWRIVGVRVRVSIDVTKWWWSLKLATGTLTIHVGPFHSWTEPEYRQEFHRAVR